MEYSLQILKQEKFLLEKCLKGFNKEKHPEAFKNRNRKLRDINKTIKLITES